MGLSTIINKSLTPTVSPMVYVMMFISVFIGFCFATDLLVGPLASVLYTTGVLLENHVWGAVLFLSAGIAEIGLIKKNRRMIQLGSLWAFMAWLLACFDLLFAAQWYVLVTVGLFHLVFQGYVVLASSLGYLYRRPI